MDRQLPPISDRILYERALTHRSYLNEHPEVRGNNERLEFLGDAVLGFLIGEMLYKLYPTMNEAQMTHLRSRLVDERQLSQIGGNLGLGKLIRLGKGAEKDGGRTNPSLLNDAFEAIVGAYFLDAGIDGVRDYILPIFIPLVKQLVNNSTDSSPHYDHHSQRSSTTFIDSKNRFQQWALSHHNKHPTYQIIAESGPDHAKEFTAQVSINQKVYGIGKGRRKQEAEKRAAEAALATVLGEIRESPLQ
ncbi:MAG: ribonuclease III [Pleurocapsa sp.]